MKGQTQAVTAVLITTVVIGSVATAYVWGTPIIQKRESKAQLAQTEGGALNLYQNIVEVSRSGSGTTEKVELGGSGTDLQVMVNEENDSIEIMTSSKNPPYPIDVWTLIKGKTMQNLSMGSGSYAINGEDLPGVVAVKPVGGAGESVINYRIEFRNLYMETPTGNRLKKIDIQTQGRNRAVDGATLLITNEGTEIDSGKDSITLPTGEKIERTRTVVSINIR